MKTRSVFAGLALFLTFLLGGCWNMGGGEKIGSITRLQRTGVFCKTWEGEIIRGGLNSGSGVVGNAFHFTVEDDELAQQAQKAMETQQEVKITYKKEGFSFCRSDSDNYFLAKIEPLDVVSRPPTQVDTIPLSTKSDITQELLKQNQMMIINQQAMLEEMRKQRMDSERNKY